ncbi:MAG: hypothetical protein WAW96_17335 [Alphaproteobacteria bacterium]
MNKAEICAANSVDWYRAILATHGLVGNIESGVFVCTGKVPPYYSNASTFVLEDAGAQMRVITALAKNLIRPFSINDCYARLPLDRLGFRKLFDAQWIWHDTELNATGRAASPWRRITTAEELKAWEVAWRALGSPTGEPVFLPPLLQNPAVAIFAAHKGANIVAVCAANRSERAVGLSNFFTSTDGDAMALLNAALAEIAAFAPGLPIVGYERGDALENAVRAGFSVVGPLRIWLAGTE